MLPIGGTARASARHNPAIVVLSRVSVNDVRSPKSFNTTFCALTRKAGAKSSCEGYGHRHALKVENVTTADGAPIGELSGKTLHYLVNDESAALLNGDDFHEDRVKVTGRLFVQEQALEVIEIRGFSK